MEWMFKLIVIATSSSALFGCALSRTQTGLEDQSAWGPSRIGYSTLIDLKQERTTVQPVIVEGLESLLKVEARDKILDRVRRQFVQPGEKLSVVQEAISSGGGLHYLGFAVLSSGGNYRAVYWMVSQVRKSDGTVVPAEPVIGAIPLTSGPVSRLLNDFSKIDLQGKTFINRHCGHCTCRFVSVLDSNAGQVVQFATYGFGITSGQTTDSQGRERVGDDALFDQSSRILFRIGKIIEDALNAQGVHASFSMH